MKTSTQIITTAIAALALGAGGLVFAQQGQGDGSMHRGMHGGMHGGKHSAQTAEDVAARLATLKTELAITAAQEPAWQQFEGVVREHAQARQAMRASMQARMQDPAAAASTDHAAQREAMMKLHEKHKAEGDAARKALYAVLTPEQKALADQRLMHGRQGKGMHKHAG